jgi:hypothetical protein
MEIKHSGPIQPLQWRGVDAAETSRRKGRFLSSQQAPSSADNAASSTLSGVRGAYRRKDLQDGSRRDAAVQDALEEMMKREFPAADALTPVERGQLAGWMAQDPMIRTRMVNYLERTLE